MELERFEGREHVERRRIRAREEPRRERREAHGGPRCADRGIDARRDRRRAPLRFARVGLPGHPSRAGFRTAIPSGGEGEAAVEHRRARHARALGGEPGAEVGEIDGGDVGRVRGQLPAEDAGNRERVRREEPRPPSRARRSRAWRRSGSRPTGSSATPARAGRRTRPRRGPPPASRRPAARRGRARTAAGGERGSRRTERRGRARRAAGRPRAGPAYVPLWDGRRTGTSSCVSRLPARGREGVSSVPFHVVSSRNRGSLPVGVRARPVLGRGRRGLPLPPA